MAITSKLEEITPEKARRWLKKNVKNRRIRSNRTTALAAAIKRGEWQINGASIAVIDTGKMIDGQHRLEAIELSGVTVKSLVVRGLPESAQESTDRNLVRSFADALYIAEEANVTVLASACSLMWRFENNAFGKQGFGKHPTFAQLHDVLNRHPELRRAVSASANYRAKG